MPTTRVDFKHVRAHASFEAVAEHYEMDLIGKGDQRSALCSFHEEQRPSLKINLAKNIFHCFGCGKSGNILEFVTYMEGGDPSVDRDLRASGLLLAEISKIDPVPQPSAQAPSKKSEKPQARARTERTPAALHHQPKPQREEALHNKPLSFSLKLDATHPYLKKRGLAQKVIETFGLGVADRGLMKGRLAIPIHNEDGTLIAYAGRWAATVVPKDVPKYLLPEKFAKHLMLFNLHRVPVGTQHVVLVESYFSVFRLHELGIPVVSPMGHVVSEEHCVLLEKRGIERVTLLFDGDAAGAQGIARSLPVLARLMFVRAPKVPDGFRPDECPEAHLHMLLGS
jgi:DNA primase